MSAVALAGADCYGQSGPADLTQEQQREYRFTLAYPLIKRAEADSKAAAEARIATVNQYFTARKKAARPFAKKVLSEGKSKAAEDAAGGVMNAISGLFGYKPSSNNALSYFVRETFRKEVLDPEELRKVVDAATSGYVSDVLRIERKLAVAIRIDVPENAYGIGLAWYLKPTNSFGIDNGTIIGKLAKVVVNDLAASAVQYTASYVAGNKAADLLTKKDDPIGEKLVVGALAGKAADDAINQAILAAGYQPENDMVADIEKALDDVWYKIMHGESLAKEQYDYLMTSIEQHSNNKLRAACRQAADTIRERANLGLVHRLMTVHQMRSHIRVGSLKAVILHDRVISDITDSHAEPTAEEQVIIAWAHEADKNYRRHYSR